MLDRARFLLISEVSEASGKSAEDVEENIDKALAETIEGNKDKVES